MNEAWNELLEFYKGKDLRNVNVVVVDYNLKGVTLVTFVIEHVVNNEYIEEWYTWNAKGGE